MNSCGLKRIRVSECGYDSALTAASGSRPPALLPGGRSPTARLANFDVTTERYHENVAMATSVPQAHADLWQSPSHRQALLDRRVNRIGVGITSVETEGGPIHFVVQHLAEL